MALFWWLGGGRVPLAMRTLLHDWLRLGIAVGGVGFAILLVLLLQGVMDGTVAKSTTYIDHVGADVFVARNGVNNMAIASSALPEDVVARVASVDGVGEAAGITRFPVIVHAEGRERPADLVGYDLPAGLGGPWKLAKGRAPASDAEVALDRTLADELGVGVGERVTISGTGFTIVGLTEETAAIAGKIAFVDRRAAQRLLEIPGIVSFVLVRTAPGFDARQVAATLDERLPEVNALTREELSRNDRDLLGSLFVAPVNVMATIGFLVGLAIIGLTMYTTTAERMRDFGVLKAIGAPNAFLFRTVITQAAVLGVAGFVAGLAATWVAGPVVVRLVPDIGVTINAAPAARTFGAVMAMSLIGAVLPVARIVRVDPLMVFRS
ncbi:MAG TPA: ABC transporter permease [Dehalococcoidia bacterium]|nr:ABC transporter permease [Dehalococcoidia bacterium]